MAACSGSLVIMTPALLSAYPGQEVVAFHQKLQAAAVVSHPHLARGRLRTADGACRGILAGT